MEGVIPIKKIKKRQIIAFVIILCLLILGGIFSYIKHAFNSSFDEKEESSALAIEQFD